MLACSVSNFKDWWRHYENFNEVLLIEFVFSCLNLHENMKASKSANSIEAIMDTARLFPFSKKDDDLVLNISRSTSPNNLSRLCLTILEYDQKDSAEEL